MKETETQKAIDVLFIKIGDIIELFDRQKLSEDVFEIDTPNYKFQITNDNGSFRITNAVNGWGQNCKKEFEKTEIAFLEYTRAAGRSKSLDRIRELEEALRDLYNAIDSLPNWKKRDTLAQHCDMEKAKQLLNNH